MHAGESVSRPCPGGDATSFLPSTPSLPRQASFPWPYVEELNDERTKLADFFNILLLFDLVRRQHPRRTIGFRETARE